MKQTTTNETNSLPRLLNKSFITSRQVTVGKWLTKASDSGYTIRTSALNFLLDLSRTSKWNVRMRREKLIDETVWQWKVKMKVKGRPEDVGRKKNKGLLTGDEKP